MLEHQQRVVIEKEELGTKANALSVFIGSSPLFLKAEPEEQERMKEQCETMWELSEILGKRIEHFGKAL